MEFRRVLFRSCCQDSQQEIPNRRRARRKTVGRHLPAIRAGTDARGRGMKTTMQAWPQQTREFHNHHFDSTIWNDFRLRDDDIVIATYDKSGTTWVQQIVGQLIFEGGRTAEGRGGKKGVKRG